MIMMMMKKRIPHTDNTISEEVTVSRGNNMTVSKLHAVLCVTCTRTLKNRLGSIQTRLL